jgi:DNA-binding response OmpR family regulator
MYTRTKFPVVPIEAVIKTGDTAVSKLLPVVLIVDDEQVIADTLTAILNQSGYMAMAAYDGASALELARLIPPQMLITDVYMPGMNGMELAVAVRCAVPDCRVLLFSGQSSRSDMLASSHRAGYDFSALTKPIHPTELLAHISECLAAEKVA